MKINVVKMSIFEETRGYKKKMLTVVASNYKRRHGNYPKWYIHEGKKAYIDVLEFDKSQTLYERAQLYCNEKLYWIFMSAGYSDSTLSSIMAENSKRYKSTSSWMQFFMYDLFSVKYRRNVLHGSMLEDFLRIGSRYIFVKKMRNEIVFNKEKDYF